MLATLSPASARATATDVVVYRAPEQCPDAASFRARFHGRRAKEGATDPAGRTYAVDIQARDGAFVGRLTTRDATVGTEREREVVGHTCDEVVEALSLLAALAQETEEPPRPAASARPPAPPAAPEMRLGWSVGALGLVTAGLVPGGARPGVGVHAGLQLPGDGPVAPAFRLGAMGTQGEASASGVDATVSLVAGRLDACPLVLRAGEGLAVRPCASVLAGAIRGEARGIANARAETQSWLAAGPALLAGVRLTGAVVLTGELAATVALARRRFVLDGGPTLTDPPLLGLVGGIGLEFRFPADRI